MSKCSFSLSSFHQHKIKGWYWELPFIFRKNVFCLFPVWRRYSRSTQARLRLRWCWSWRKRRKRWILCRSSVIAANWALDNFTFTLSMIFMVAIVILIFSNCLGYNREFLVIFICPVWISCHLKALFMFLLLLQCLKSLVLCVVIH